MHDRFFEKITGLLFPRRCPVCGDIVTPRGELICPACARKLSSVRQPVCKRCGREVLSDRMEYCPACTGHRRSFEAGAALLNYNEAARRSMAAIKYKNKREYLDFYGAAMAGRFGRIVGRWNCNVLVPVPIHSSRRRERGFNQAEELAKRLGKAWSMPVDSALLVRVKKTAPQRELDPSERLKNLKEAIAVRERPAGDIPESVILVDDIYTTGSTVESCARALKAAGVERVYFVAICTGYGR